jgi:hypothetical protein
VLNGFVTRPSFEFDAQLLAGLDSPKNASINGGPRKPRLLTVAVVAWAPAVERPRAATMREVPRTNTKMIAPDAR